MDHVRCYRSTICKFIAEQFLLSGSSRAQSYYKLCNREILGPNRTDITHWYHVFIKVGHMTHSLQTRNQKTPSVLEPHDPYMYTLPMLFPDGRFACYTLLYHFSISYGEAEKYVSKTFAKIRKIFVKNPQI